MTPMQQAYLVCALWSSTGDDQEPLDATYGLDDIEPDSRAKMLAEVDDFVALCERDGIDLDVLEPEQIGHDFWLTRNGHGAGFWDRGLGERGDKLTDAAKTYGTCDLYVGDDGRIYVG